MGIYFIHSFIHLPSICWYRPMCQALRQTPELQRHQAVYPEVRIVKGEGGGVLWNPQEGHLTTWPKSFSE
jgi:hypothetical protein